jgi:hypothetical protein
LKFNTGHSIRINSNSEIIFALKKYFFLRLAAAKRSVNWRRCNGFPGSSDYIVKKVDNFSLSRMKTHIYRCQIFE